MSESTYKITGTFAGAEQIVGKYKEIEKAVKAVENANKALTRSADAEKKSASSRSAQRKKQLEEEERGLMKLSKQYDRYHQMQREARGILSDQFSGLRVFSHEAKSLLQAEAQFKALNLGARDTAAGLAAVEKTARQVGGVRLDNLTSDLTGLKSVFGELHNAIEFLPTAAKTRFTFQALFNADPKELEADILHTMKALEQIGAIRQLPGGGVDQERFKKFFDTAIRIKSYTGGRIGGRELRNFVSTSGVAGMALEPEGLLNMMSLMEAMGGDRTGTALMSAFMSFRALRQGAGGARAGQAMAQLGLIDLNSKSIEWTKEGRIKKLLPGAMPISDLLGKDPLQFADALAEAIKQNGQKLLPKTSGPLDMTSSDHIATILTQITGNRSSANVLAKMILMRENIRKDAEAAKKSMGLDQLHGLAEESELGKLLKFEAAVSNFQQKAGIPLLTVLTELGTAAMPFINFLGQHPKLAIWSILGIKTASSFFQIANAMRQFNMAGRVIDATSGLTATGNAAGTAATKAGRLSRVLKTEIPGMVGTTITLSLASATLAYIVQLRDEAKQAWEQAKGSAQKEADNDAKLLTSGLSIDQLNKLGKTSGTTNLARFLGGFEHAAQDKMGWWDWTTYGVNPWRRMFGATGEFDKHMPSVMQDQLPGLKNPSQFAFFMRAINESKLPQGEKDKLTGAAGKAFPESLKKYNEALKWAAQNREAAERRLLELEKSEADARAQATSVLTNEFNPALEAATDRLNKLGFITEGNPPEHAAGGLTRKDHFAKVHRNEFIIPRDEAMRYFAEATGGANYSSGFGPITVNINAPINATPGTDVQAVKAGVYQGAVDGARAIERRLNMLVRDRALTSDV
jgi:hypothetical protein